MAKKVEGYIKLQIPAGKATPAPPVGPALGQHGVNIVEFTKQSGYPELHEGVQRKNEERHRPDHPGRHHRICGQKLQFHYEDSAGSSHDQEGMQD